MSGSGVPGNEGEESGEDGGKCGGGTSVPRAYSQEEGRDENGGRGRVSTRTI